MRRPQQSILGENTPPQSATMLALHNMPTPAAKEADAPLSNVTNGSTALVKATPPNTDSTSLSGQILTLTSIATSLQKEMAALTRRSRDNATDLMSLKQATNSRDEDIRKSLRDLITNIHDPSVRQTARDPFSSGLLIDSKPHNSSFSASKSIRPFSLPRIPSPNSFAASMERDRPSTSGSTYSADAPAIIALLEKIVRDMGTREGQDLLVTRLSDVAEQLGGMASAAKVEELLDLAKNSEQAMVATGSGGGGGGNRGGGRDRNFSFGDLSDRPELPFGGASPGSGPMTRRVERLLHENDGRRASAPSTGTANVVNEDILNIIKSVKDSVAQGGGLTAEVKALVRELRGEVLGMGREIRRRLDEIATKDDDAEDQVDKERMERIISEGLKELKDHMDHLLREHRRQSAASASSKASLVDYQEIYNAVRAALKDSPAGRPQQATLNRDDIIRAVSDAWENYKPEINVEQYGLERDEVLACLQEGFQMYAPRDDRPTGATREEVFKAVVEGLKHFVPPKMESAASLSRDEILDAVRECLEEFEFPVAPAALGTDITRDDMVQAVKEGLGNFDFTASAALTVPQPSNEEITTKLNELVEFMRLEFRSVSEEAKENVAANGRDTEQVLDATKDGFEKLRADMEDYVNRMRRLSGQEEAIEQLMKVLDCFRDDVAEMLQTRIDSLRDSVNMSIVPAAPQNPNKEALEVIKDGLDSIRAELQRPLAGTGEIMDAIHDGLTELRASVEKMSNRPVDLTANDEILEALKLGLDGVRSDIDGIREARDERAVAPINDKAVVPADMLKHDDIKNLEVLITQLRIKVEAMDPQPSGPDLSTATKDDVARLEEVLRNVKDTVEGTHGAQAAGEATAADPSLREDVQAIETILRNTKARLDDLIDGEQAVRKEHMDVIEGLLVESRESLAAMVGQVDLLSRKEDLSMLESLISHVAAGYDEMKERADKEVENPERVVKSDIEAIEAVCLDLKSMVEQVAKTDLVAVLPTKEELATSVDDLKTRIETAVDANTKAMEERQAETVGVSDRITEVKAFLSEFQDMTKARLEDGVGGIETLGKLLEKMGETIANNATIGDDLRDMFETMKTEFEESRAGVVGAKLDADEKFQQTTETLGSKIDERIDELMAKYDDLQAGMDERAKTGDARDIETEAAVLGTKAVAEELKLLIDTLGSTVTESLERMEEASKTVFNRVEDVLTRTDESSETTKAEHQQTRDRIQDAIAAVEALQGPVSESQPKILETVKDILLIVGQHYEFTKTSTTDIQDKIEEAKPPPPEPPLLPPIDKYDDTCVHEKLDRLVDHSHAAGKAFAQLDTLDKVHEQVLKTAADISDFLASQTQRIEEAHEDLEKTRQETAMDLERKTVLKEQVEASIANLREEERRLREGVQGLRADQEVLTRQKTRLTADVSSLETALRLRRDELHDMEGRAESLERRIVEGVMDHSRVLLMAKASKGPDAMSRKRVKIQRPSETLAASDHQLSRPAAKMALAMKRAPNPAGSARRIVSLGQINNNVAAGGFKRSHSVKAPSGMGRGGMRKSSWGGSLARRYGELDKENVSLKESDEENDYGEGRHDVGTDGASEAGTPRRASSGTYALSTTTGHDMSDAETFDDDDDLRSEQTESAVGTTLSDSTVAGNEIVLLEP